MGSFSLPHDIVTNDDGSLFYVADRENARVQILRSDGQFVGEIINPINTTAFWNIYSVDYYGLLKCFTPTEHTSVSKNLKFREFVCYSSMRKGITVLIAFITEALEEMTVWLEKIQRNSK